MEVLVMEKERGGREEESLEKREGVEEDVSEMR